MQEKRNERREGATWDIRLEGATIASELMEVDDATKKMAYQKEYQSMIDSISLDAETFTHHVPAYQILAQQGDVEAEEAMHLVHTSQSLQRAKDSLAALPSNAESEEFESEDSQSTRDESVSGIPDFLFNTKTPYSDFNVEIMRQYQSARAEHQSADPQRKVVLQHVMASLKLQKMQMLIHRSSFEEVKTQVRDVKIDLDSRLEQLAPTATQKVLQKRFIKEDSLAKSVQQLTTRVEKMESQMEQFLHHQTLQTQLLEKLVAAPTPTQTLDANKKGEKVVEAVATTSQIKISERGEAASKGEQQPTIVVNPQEFIVKASPSKSKALPVALFEEFDLSNMSEEEKLARIEALQKMKEESNERIMRSERLINASIVSNLFSSQTSAPTISTTILKLLTQELVAPTFYDAEPSCVKEFEPFIKTRAYSPPKANGKNKLQLDFPFPKNEEEKLMGKKIKEFKENNNKSVRDWVAVIFRNGKVLHISNSHPRFVEAKREETSRLLREAHPGTEFLNENSEEKQARLAQELMDEMDREEREPEELPKPVKRKGGSKPRLKKRTKRPFSPQEDTRETSGTQFPFQIPQEVINPSVNFHEEKIVPKEEPVEFDKIEVPKFLLESTQKKRTSRKQILKGPILVSKVPSIVKQSAVENKEDYIYQAEIEEYSGINLFLDEVSEVRGIDKFNHLPERLAFVYKGGKQRTWPLQKVLGENYHILTKVFSSIKRSTGFSKVAKGEILKRIEQI